MCRTEIQTQASLSCSVSVTSTFSTCDLFIVYNCIRFAESMLACYETHVGLVLTFLENSIVEVGLPGHWDTLTFFCINGDKVVKEQALAIWNLTLGIPLSHLNLVSFSRPTFISLLIFWGYIIEILWLKLLVGWKFEQCMYSKFTDFKYVYIGMYTCICIYATFTTF